MITRKAALLHASSLKSLISNVLAARLVWCIANSKLMFQECNARVVEPYL